MNDPILDAMFEGEEFDSEESQGFSDEYGKGKWPAAILREVTPGKTGDFSHTIILKVDLKGEEGMPFTFFADAPFKPEENGSPDKYEQSLKGYNIGLNRIKTFVHCAGQWVTSYNAKGYKAETTWPKSFADFRDEATYNKLVAVFQQLVGSNMPLNVKYRKYTNKAGEEKSVKDCWGLDVPRQES